MPPPLLPAPPGSAAPEAEGSTQTGPSFSPRAPLNFSILSPLPGARLQLLLLGCEPKQPGLPGAASSFPGQLGFLLRGEPSQCLTKPRKLRLSLLGTSLTAAGNRSLAHPDTSTTAAHPGTKPPPAPSPAHSS